LYGALDSAWRSADQTGIGLFWACDRVGMEPPPVLFIYALDRRRGAGRSSSRWRCSMAAMIPAARMRWSATILFEGLARFAPVLAGRRAG
jgi:hypothetical protein